MSPQIATIRIAVLTALHLILGLTGAYQATAGTPRANSLFPSGAQRGTEMEVKVIGQNLGDARTLLFNTPGFKVTSVKAEGNSFTAKIEVSKDAQLGEHIFRVVTASGISDTRLFYVTPFPMVAETAEPKDGALVPQPVALGTTVYGRTQNEDQDSFEVEVAKGQRITAEVTAFQLQTQQIYDPYLIISNAEGTILAEVDDSSLGRSNPVASIVAPATGKYRITIKDSTNAGPGECHYLMHIGSFPRPLMAYPAGGQVGTTLALQLVGDAGGLRDKTVELPKEATAAFPIFDEGDDQLTPTPNFIRVSPFPNLLENEPNNSSKTPTRMEGSFPIAFNGVIQEAGDRDVFLFTAKKGEALDFQVYARVMRSPIDPVIEIWKANGQSIANNDDAGKVDSYLRWAAPEDGEFCLMVKDQLGRGGPLFVYRVEVTRVLPQVALWLPEMTINSSQDRRAVPVPKGNRYATLVKARRADAATGFEILANQLPAGVKATPIIMDKSVDAVPVVFEAAADAATTEGHFVLEGKATDEKLSNVVSKVEHKVDVAENGNRRAFYGVTEEKLPVAVTDAVPVTIDVVVPEVPIVQNGQMQLRVKAQRRDGFKGVINLALLYAPPGVGSAGLQPIPADKDEGVVTISANATAPLMKWKICVVGNAEFTKGATWISSQLVDLQVAAPYVTGAIARSFVDQGDETELTLKLEQKIPFEGKAKVTLSGLPNDVTTEAVEITKETTEVKLKVKAGPKAPIGSHRNLFCQFLLPVGEQSISYSFAGGGVLRIDAKSVVQK